MPDPTQFIARAPLIDGIARIVAEATGNYLNEAQQLLFASSGATRARVEPSRPRPS